MVFARILPVETTISEVRGRNRAWEDLCAGFVGHEHAFVEGEPLIIHQSRCHKDAITGLGVYDALASGWTC
ncbi:MAG: hypothetical protein MI923_12030 [Phycisphaerales bacterium]|nr:hypothetical protein [Phycisphaerales bacterium]